jgi:LysM repeat protein
MTLSYDGLWHWFISYINNNSIKITEVNNMSFNIGPELLEYSIQSGDTLWDLADELEISVDDIIAVNEELDPANLSVGQIIYLPGNSELYASQRPPEYRPRFRPRPFRRYRPYECRRPYFIRPGDTLYRLSYQFGIPARAIMNANPNINFEYPLQVGQSICLP